MGRNGNGECSVVLVALEYGECFVVAIDSGRLRPFAADGSLTRLLHAIERAQQLRGWTGRLKAMYHAYIRIMDGEEQNKHKSDRHNLELHTMPSRTPHMESGDACSRLAWDRFVRSRLANLANQQSMVSWKSQVALSKEISDSDPRSSLVCATEGNQK